MWSLAPDPSLLMNLCQSECREENRCVQSRPPTSEGGAGSCLFLSHTEEGRDRRRAGDRWTATTGKQDQRHVGTWSHLVWNSLLFSQLKQETGQGLWVLCGEERLFRERIISGVNTSSEHLSYPSQPPGQKTALFQEPGRTSASLSSLELLRPGALLTEGSPSSSLWPGPTHPCI